MRVLVNCSRTSQRSPMDLTPTTIAELIRGKHSQSSDLKFYRLSSPGISPPGVEFSKLAQALYGELDDPALAVDAFYFHCLYSWNPIKISVSDGNKSYVCHLIRGHFLGAEFYGPQGVADLVIIGKMPGFEESKVDRNFHGPSGEVLKRGLKNVGFTDDQINAMYVTNAVRWYCKDWNSARLPVRWIEECKPLLDEELRILRPKAVLLLGQEAVKALFGFKATLKSFAGSAKTLKIPIHKEGEPEKFHEITVFAAIHPAAVCRSPELQTTFEGQLKQVYDFLTSGRVTARNDDIKYEVIKTIEGLKQCIDSLIQDKSFKKIAVDLEWQGSFPTQSDAFVRTVQLCKDPGFVYVIELFDDRKNQLIDRNMASTEFNRLFSQTNIQFGGSFFVADLCWLKGWLNIPVENLFKEIPFNEFCTGNFPGIFDVAIAEHAHNETGPFDLCSMAAIRCGYSVWDQKLEEWKTKYCSDQDIAKKELLGYGECPDYILIPYAALDAAAVRDLMDKECELLNSDRYGHSSWQAFYTSMMAYPAFFEMHYTGAKIDREQLSKLSLSYALLYAEKLQKLREDIHWPNFNPRSVIYDCIELLFGEKYTGCVDNKGNPIRRRPKEAISLELTPIKATNDKLWSALTAEEKTKLRPSTDKEVCSILATQHPVVAQLRDLRFIDHILKTVLRLETDDEGNYKCIGIGRFIMEDGRVHSQFMPIIETGRANSVRPQMQNLAKRREATYQAIFGDKYPGPLRSIIIPERGYKLIEADFKIAELVCMAVLSQDKTLLEHCKLNMLPEDHPDYYDIHSHIAVAAFKLDCKPTKKDLTEKGFKHLRVGAKAIVYGSLYGRGVDAIYRQCLEEGVSISREEVELLMYMFFDTYPGLKTLQDKLKMRVEDPGWIRTCFGRYRRFYKTDDKELLATQQREAMNFPAQSMVADLMNRGLKHLYFHPDRKRLGYRIISQIHDACLLEVPEESVDEMVNVVIPECLTKNNTFLACDLDGIPYPNSDVYSLETDISVMDRWV